MSDGRLFLLASEKGANHPLSDVREVEFLLPPTLGMPFVFAGNGGGGNTSYVVSGTFTVNDETAVWEFQTRSGSKYQLLMELRRAAPDPFAGGPVGHA